MIRDLTQTVLAEMADTIKKTIEGEAKEHGDKLKKEFNERIDKRLNELVVKTASEIVQFCSIRSIDRDSVEIRIVVQRKEKD